MRELPRTCPEPCADVAFGGAAYDVGRAGFVAAISLGVRDVDGATPTPLGPVRPGTQTADACIYPDSASTVAASPDPAHHPTGCDLVTTDPLSTAGGILNAVSAAHPVNDVSGWSYYDYGARGRVYVGFRGAVANAGGRWQNVAGYGVWLRDGFR